MHVVAADDSLSSNALTQRVKGLASRLRREQMHQQRKNSPNLRGFEEADIYFEHGPSGSYPIVTLRSLPCEYFLRGECVPCAYSARPRPANSSHQDPYAGLLVQVDHLLGRFDDLFSQRSNGTLPGYCFRSRKHTQIYMLQLAGESSFFSDREIPPDYRLQILEKFVQFGRQRGVDWHLMLETRSEDLLKAEKSGELERLQPLLEQLNVVVNMGFEHRHEFLRQVVFAKGLETSIFLRAVGAAQKHGLDPGVFLFAGGFMLTPGEALDQVAQSLELMSRLGVFVNLMLPNLQPYTIPDVLYEQDVCQLPEPWWLLDLVDLLKEYWPDRRNAITPFHWFVGGFVAEPVPLGTVIEHRRRRTSRDTSMAVLSTVKDLMVTGEMGVYEDTCKILRSNLNKWHYEETSEQWERMPWPSRTNYLLDICENSMENYFASKISGVRSIE